MTRQRLFTFLPVLVFLGLALLFWKGLTGDPSSRPSALLGKAAPEFTLPAVEGLGVPAFSRDDLGQGKVAVVNVWASWCAPCRAEHPLLMKLAQRQDLRLFGINNKDKPEHARRFLSTLGQPFQAVGADKDGRVSLNWGVFGVPETFIVDGKGIVRYRHIGALSEAALTGEFGKALDAAAKP